MLHLGCIPPPLAPRARGGRVPRLPYRLAFVLAPALVVAALGCGNDAESPTEPAPAVPQASVSVASALEFSQLSAGYLFTCGVTTQSQAWCWGRNNYGQLGTGKNDFPRPLPVLGGLYFRQVSAGEFHTCAVTTDYRGYCWGYNYWGQLGDSSTTLLQDTPVAVVGGLRFFQVDGGTGHTCGVTYPDRRAYCWGNNASGQLGDGTLTTRISPVLVQGGLQFRQVSAGRSHTCGVTTSNQVFCWGSNQYGQIGDNSTAYSRLTPRLVAGAGQFRQVVAGGYHSCAVTTTNRAFCWGRNGSGQVGDGTTTLRRWPRAVAGGLYFTRATAGDKHTCGEATTKRAYCWGDNYFGQVGDGTTSTRLRPVAVAAGLYFSQVSAGGWHTCGKTSAGLAYCWGSNLSGELGDATTTNRLTPTAVTGP